MIHKKHIIIYLIGVFVVFGNACTQNTSSVFYKVKNPEKITKMATGFFNPKFSPDGKMILFTGINNNGLYLYDIKKDKQTTVTTVKGTGSDAGFTADSKMIFYVTKTFTTFRSRSNLILQRVVSSDRKVVTSNIRKLKVIHSFFGPDNNILVFSENDEIKQYNLTTEKTQSSSAELVLAFSNDDLNLTTVQNGKMNALKPKGSGDYLWVSVSPDTRRILFSISGKACYSCDLNGGGLIEYGRLHAPVWSPSGKFVIGMNDYDNGESYTKSDIVMYTADGKNSKILTSKTDIIALFPTISPDEKMIVFNDESGVVYKMNIQ